MKKIYDAKTVTAYLKESTYGSILENLHCDPYLIRYEKGELVTSPFHDELLFQIIVDGSLNIYFIRDDGTKYSLSTGNKDYILGDTDIFQPRNNNIYAEAAEDLTAVTLPINENRTALLADPAFLQLICNSVSVKLIGIANMNASPATLTERVLSYMQYKCDQGVLQGLEQAAFHLHCSSRQLQRIMNQCEKDGIVKRIGKGTYQLTYL